MTSLAAGNPMLRVLAVNLGCAAVAFGLAIPAMIASGTDVGVSFAAGGSALACAVVAAATQHRRWGGRLGWLALAGGVALGALTPWMFAVGGLFLGLHVLGHVLGRRLDAAADR